jgi:hypothetical protein
MREFLDHWAAKSHSIIITGEELNTQFYAPEDGGKALDFLDYWIGVIRTVSPKTFVWCRIDEQLKRKNGRNKYFSYSPHVHLWMRILWNFW